MTGVINVCAAIIAAECGTTEDETRQYRSELINDGWFAVVGTAYCGCCPKLVMTLPESYVDMNGNVVRPRVTTGC